MINNEIKRQVRLSLGLPAMVLPSPTLPIEGHVCDFPLWSYSKKRSSITRLRIDYEDGSFFELDAPKGMPSPSFPGYLDVILFYGQRDLFRQNFVELSAYSVMRHLHIDPERGSSYQSFVRDMERNFALMIKTDRLIDPETRQRTYVTYFRILDTMKLTKSRKGTSRFYFNQVFLDSLRSGYLKRLDWEYCLDLDRKGEALTRFLYSHLLKRIGEKSLYQRNLSGFLHDIGLGYLTTGEPKRITETLKRTVYPALDAVRGIQYQLDSQGNLVFIPKY